MVRVMLVDAQAVLRQGLRWELQLEPDLDIVGEANAGAEGVALAQLLRPDIVIMDVEMPVMDGIQAATSLHALAPGCVVLLMTIHDGRVMSQRALAAGAHVLLEKGNPALFRATLHDLVQLVKARNTPAWPESTIDGETH